MPWRPAPSPCADTARPPRRRLAAAAFGAAALGTLPFAGCTFSSDIDHADDDAPREQALARAPRIAWVLSSGGPRGFTHVGVLRALHEMALAPELIVGASVGALVGAFRASGLAAPAIETVALDLQPWSLARMAIGAEERFSGGPVAELARRHSAVQRLERMPIAMACVAYRQREGRTVAFTAGDVGLAVQASSAIEGQFAPVRIRGETYVDADWHNPLPVRLARALGARTVIAVDATAHIDRAPPGAERYRDGDARKKALVDIDAKLADLVLKPDFGYWVSLSRDFRERAIAAGYRDTMTRERELRALHRA